jgi:nitrite reductase/ring-hydroxylating ferredoxin subunit
MRSEDSKPEPANDQGFKDTGSGDGSWHKLEGFDASATHFPTRARLNGEVIWVFPFKDGFRGVERACPHLKATLGNAVLMANGTVLRCPQHNFTFRLSDGKGVSPMNTKLQIFEVKVEDGIAYGRPAN